MFAVKAIAGVIALGFYSYAFRVTEPFRYLALAIESSLYSHLAGRLTSRSGSLPRFAFIDRLVFSYALAFSVLAYLAAEILTKEIFPGYAVTGDAILVLSCALFFRCVNGYQTALQNALGNFRLTAKFSVVGLVATGALIYPLTRYEGFFGAALTLLIMEAINFAVQRYFRRPLTSHPHIASS